MAKIDLYKDAQRRLVGSVIADGDNVNRVLELVGLDDFAEPALQHIFESIVNVTRLNQTPSAITVATDLETRGLLSAVGGAGEIYKLRTSGAKWRLEAPPEVYASIVKEQSAKARMKEVLDTYKESFSPDSGQAAVDAISEMQNLFNSELYKLSDESTVAEMAGSMDQYFELLEARRLRSVENADGAQGLQGIPSLLPTLNSYTGGWQPGQLITVGARTGIGKSVFAINNAVAAAKAGKSVLFFSLEMGEDEIKDRMISSMTGIPMNHLKQGTLSEDEMRILKNAKDEINSMKVVLDTNPKVTIDSIRARALKKAQSEEGLDLIIIDYLQLITPVGRHGNRQEAVAEISRNTKLLAKQLQLPIMVLVQVNRETSTDDSNVPRMSQIRESNSIAQDSDMVILLHREDSLDDAIPHTLVILEKNRNGESDKTIRCHSNLECSLFREVQRAKDVENSVTDEDIEALDNYSDDDDLDLNFDDDFELD